jgi:hypothetical protein
LLQSPGNDVAKFRLSQAFAATVLGLRFYSGPLHCRSKDKMLPYVLKRQDRVFHSRQ